jgi:hypothetical protein
VPELTIHEADDGSGALVRTHLVSDGDDLELRVGDASSPLPAGALDAVMKRFGRPLAEDVPPEHVAERLELTYGRALVRFRFRPRYDVIARDYLAYYAPGEEPVCELATAVSAALEHLARARRP